MKRLIGPGLIVAGVLYPVGVYWGTEHFAPWQFGLLLGVLWFARALTARRSPSTLAMAGVAMVFCALLSVANDEWMLRWYPVLVSVFMLGLFGASLVYGPPIVERMARMQRPDLPESGVRYTRKVTQIWCVFFLGNGLTAAALTLWAPLSWWTLYTGLISYALMGLLFAGEWYARRRVVSQA